MSTDNTFNKPVHIQTLIDSMINLKYVYTKLKCLIKEKMCILYAKILVISANPGGLREKKKGGGSTTIIF